MSLGALLIGLAAAILLVAYVLSPFRRVARTVDVDAQIEAWVAEARQAGGATPVVMTEDATGVPEARATSVPAESVPAGTAGADTSEGKTANFCHHCGEPVQPHHRYCPNCGTRLVEA